MLVLTAEYIVLGKDNQFYLPAEMVLTSISIVLFLILAIALHGTETRLFYRIPVLSAAALLVYLRIIHLREDGRWALRRGSVSLLLIGEIAAGLHYWPMGSVGFGIALTGPLYALIEISDRLPLPGEKLKTENLIWPLVILSISWVIAFLV
jgi:hypothetical protein